MNLFQPVKLPLTWGLGSLFLGMLLTFFAAKRVDNENHLIAQTSLVKEAEKLAQETSKRISLYEYGLRGARGFILGSGDQLSRASFHQYSLTRQYEKEFPGAMGFGFIRRVPLANEKVFLEQARADGEADFTLHQFESGQEERYIIQYAEPQPPNQLAIGLDIHSENFRRAAADNAISTGQVQITAPITLVQANQKLHQSFLMLLPVYSSWTTPDSENERWQEAIGWTFTPLSMQDILDTLNIDEKFYQLQLTDISNIKNPVDFYNSEESKDHASLYTHRITRVIYGRVWQFDITAKPQLLSSLVSIKVTDVYTFGALLSFLFGLIATILGINRQAKQKIAAQQSALAAIVESTHDGIIGKALDGTITSWNKGAAEIFGYSSKEVIGKKLIDLIIPENLHNEEENILFKINNGEEVKQFVTTRVTKEGKLIDVLVNVSPVFDKQGKVVSASKTVRDITEIKTAERKIIDLNSNLETRVNERTRELDDARRNLQTLLDAVPSVISYWDTLFSNHFANRAHLQRFGYSVDTIQHMTFGGVIGHEMFSYLLPYLEQAFDGHAQKLEYSVIIDNREHHFLIQLLPDINDNKMQGFYFIEHDITEQIESRIKLTNTLREQQALHNTVNAQFLYSSTDFAGKIQEVNDLFCQITGYSRKELIGQDHRILNSGSHTRDFWQKMWVNVKQGIAWRAEVCNKTKSGELLWFESVISPMLDVNGKIEKLISLHSDITDRKRAEEHRNQLNQLIENILSAATEVAIITTDLQGNITLFNRGAERMLGYKASEVVGKATPLILHAEEEIIARGKELSMEYGFFIEGFNVFTHKAKTGQPETRRWTYINKEKSSLQVSLTFTGMMDENNKLIGFLAVAVDITDQDKLESELRAEKENADAANTAKSQFLANMSHEIRTPMNAVLGMLQLVQQTSLTQNQQDYIGKAKSAAQSLLGILNDILDFSKIEAGKLLLDPHPFSIEEMLEDLAVIMSINRANKPVELIFDLPVDLPKEVIADRLRLQQILVNLTANALKFTESGHVKVSIKRLLQTEKDISISINVTDTGIGISHEHQQKIFAGFTQAEASTTRRFGGTGLGLVICKRLTDMMGTTLLLQSEPGKGSQFWFNLTLPIIKTVSTKPDPLLEQKLRILLIDDNPLVIDTLKEFLHAFPWQCDAAFNAEVALHKIQQAELQDNAYDITLMDWQIPDINGLNLSKKIYTDINIKKPPKIILLSANENELITADEKPYIQNVLVKPLTPRQVIKAILQVFSSHTENKPKTSRPIPNTPLKDLNILVVEDNEINRQVACELLTYAGAKVDLADGGLEGVAKVTQNKTTYDLVIMDLQMPDIDGFEATKRIRADQRFQDLPILAMTANASEADRQACLAAGMNDHTGKPFDLVKLIPLMTALIHKKAPTVPQDQEKKNVTLLEDINSLLSRYAGSFELFKRFQKKFKPDVEKLLNNLDKAMSEKNLATATSSLHSIKGLAATLGATALSQHASELEKASKQQVMPQIKDLKRLTQLLIDSDNEMERMVNAESKTSDEPEVSSKKTLAELSSKLETIAKHLQTSNMDAIYMFEQLQNQLPDNQLKKEMIGYLHNLEFTKAHTCLYKIIESL